MRSSNSTDKQMNQLRLVFIHSIHTYTPCVSSYLFRQSYHSITFLLFLFFPWVCIYLYILNQQIIQYGVYNRHRKNEISINNIYIYLFYWIYVLRMINSRREKRKFFDYSFIYVLTHR
jgi:hypothetical protein